MVRKETVDFGDRESQRDSRGHPNVVPVSRSIESGLCAPDSTNRDAEELITLCSPCRRPLHNAARFRQSFGKRNAIYSPEKVPPLTARTMYCLPSSMYVMGEPLCGAGRYTAPTSLPLALS